MAESLQEKRSGSMLSIHSSVECAVCLQTCVHPAELPCGHIFCYLCIKGIVNQGRRCAMCRQDIPVDYLDKPRLLKPLDTENSSQGFEDGHLWFYEGHNGWWQYDERTSLELESAYQKGERCCELLIAGFLYIADFDAMVQYRRNDTSRRRRIKRDLATISKKGVAGLKVVKDNSAASLNTPDLVVNVLIPDLQSLHISGQPMSDHLNDNGLLADLGSSISASNYVETSHNDQISRDRNPSQFSSNSTHNTNSLDSRSLNAQLECDDTFYSRNFELHNMIHNTLDWTIQQIESLNLELSNDYENLFRDVDSYGQLHNILDRSRSDRLENDSFNQFSTSGSRLNRSLESELESSDRPTTLPNRNRSEGNISFERRQNLPEDINSSSTNVRDRLTNRPAFLPGILSGSNFSRSRDISQIGTRRVSPRSSSSLRDQETLF